MAKQLTAQQSRFINAVAAGVNPTQAARVAGYVEPAIAGYKLMRSANVVKVLHERRQSLIEGDLAQLAVQTMRELMTDGPAAQRYQASRYVLELSGHRSAEPRQQGEKALEDMTGEELADAVRSGTQALADIAASLGGQHVVDGERREVREVNAIEHDPYDGLLD